MFEDDEMTVDAEPEDVADSPIDDTEEQPEANDEAAEDTGATEQEKPAALAEQQPKKQQSKADDSKFAAARREAEMQLTAEKQRMDAFAKQYGYPSFEAMERAEAAKKYTEQGIPDAIAQEMVAQRRELEELKTERERLKAERAESERWNALFTAHPEVKSMADVHEEVREAVANGEQPIHAYRAYLVRKQADEINALKQNSANRDKALGNIKGKTSAHANTDPFLTGLGG